MNDLQIAVATGMGALLVLVAVWLLVARREAGSNRAKILGLEFEVSTPALVVLAAGAGLLIGPAMVPYRRGGWPVASGGTGGSAEPAAPGADTLRRQQIITTSELEPNNRAGEANVVAFGGIVSGRLTEEDPIDLFVFRTPPGQARRARVIARFVTHEGYQYSVSAWNEKEESLVAKHDCCGHATVSELVAAASSYLVEVRMKPLSGSPEIEVEYDLSLVADSDR